MILFLVRHGETQHNADGILQGWLDVPLNEEGKRRAREAAEKFDTKVDALYSSDLKRSAQTAKEFRGRLPHLPYKEDARLRERYLGVAQGTRRDAHDWDLFRSSRGNVTIEGSEEHAKYAKRIREFLDMLQSNHPEDAKILIVTHGGTINMILELTKTKNEHYSVRNCEILEVSL